MVKHARDPRGLSRDSIDLPDLVGLGDHNEKMRTRKQRAAVEKDGVPPREIKKSISVYITAHQWSALRAESVATGKSHTEILRVVLDPLLDQLVADQKTRKAA